MGLFDKVKVFLDDGKINGSTDKSKTEEKSAVSEPAKSVTAPAEAAENKAVSAPQNPNPEKYAMNGDQVEFPFSFAGGVPYKGADGNEVDCRFAGKAFLKAKVDLADKELVRLVLNSAPQQAYFNVLMKKMFQQVSLRDATHS